MKDEPMRDVLLSLASLFGINALINNAGHVIEGDFIQPGHVSSLKKAKESLLRKIRPHLIGLVDSFALRESMIKSELTYGNPYQVNPIVNLELSQQGSAGVT